MNTSTSSNITDIGGLAYFFAYMGDYMPFVILTSIGVILGISGENILLIIRLKGSCPINKDPKKV